MANNEILPFAGTDTGTNLLTQAEYNADSQRPIGNQPGVARSKLVNKVLRQTSLIASAIAQYFANRQSSDITDSLSAATLAGYMLNAIGGDTQKSSFNSAIAAGTADAITASYTPAVAALTNGLSLFVRATAANTSTTPTFTPNSGVVTAKAIVKGANQALVAGDIAGAGHWLELQYDSTLDKWVLQNPAYGVASAVAVLGGMKNRIINGNMVFDQRNKGAAVTPTATGYTLDRWQLACTQASKLTVQRVTDAPLGSTNSLKVTVASQYAPLATDIFNVNQPIEGNNIVDLQFGTSGALQITTSFQVKASIAGTYSCAVHNGALNRSYVATYTIGSAGVWTPVILTLSGDQTGTWATDNTTGLWIDFDLGSGTNFNNAGGTWAAGNLKRTAGSVTFVNQTAGATWQLAQVQVERGAVASPTFEPRSYATELDLCRRYYEVLGDEAGHYPSFDMNSAAAGVIYSFPVTFKTVKRSTPTTTKVGTWQVSNCAQPVVVSTNSQGAQLSVNPSTSGWISVGCNAVGQKLTVASEL